MKKILIFIYCWGLPTFILGQIALVNDGSSIVIETGIDVKVENGSVNNLNGANINNNGRLYLDLDYNQTTAASYTGGGSSWLWFEGTANQNINSDAVLSIPRLKVDNGNRLLLGNQLNISNVLDLNNNGIVELSNFNLTLSPSASIINYDASHYIVTNGTGFVQQEVAASNVVFPVGNSLYNPAILNNSGTTDNFTVRVEDQVLDVYPAGTAETNGVVGRAWMIDEVIAGGSNITLTLQWNTSEELPTFDRTVSGISHWIGSAWDRSPTWTNATTVGASSWSQTRSNITSFSPFVVEDQQQILPIELLSFTAVRKNKAEVDLNWSTASELNNKGFEVERMLETENAFSKIAWVNGRGNSTQTTYYQLLDKNAFSNVSYYRLKQVDLDGTFSYSDIRAVRGVEDGARLIDVFPNPIDDYINIRLTTKATTATIKVQDASGKEILIATKKIPSTQLITIDNLSDLSAGVYLISVETNKGEQYCQKVVKVEN